MRYAVLPLTGSYAETAPLSRSLIPAGRGTAFRFDRFLSRVEYLLAHRKIDTVLVDHHLDFRAAFPADLEAIRHELVRLKAAGRKVVYYARAYDTASLYLGSAASERIVDPLGALRYQGMARSFLFFKRLLERYDITAEVVRRGRYKSAGDRFRVDDLDEANREQHEAVLDATMHRFSEAILQDLGKRQEELDALLAGAMLSAEQAVAAGWVTRAVLRSRLIAEWKKAKAREARLTKVKTGFGRGKRVAVLVLEGAIVDGRTRQDPLLGQAIGSDSFVPEIEKLTRNKSIKAVLLRINSPGGSAVASEEIADALSLLAEKKPLVVSMSGVAGSGGYWVAVPGQRIFAESTTITGSVGVITMLFCARKGLKRLGVTEATVKIGELADLGSPFREITDRDRSVIEQEVERLYQAFLSKVAAARNSSAEEVHKIAEGRIWAGAHARERGLVDDEGGVGAALAYLRERLGAKRLRVEFHPTVRYSLIQRLIIRNAASAGSDGFWLERIAGLRALPSSFLFRSQGGPLALMPDPGEWL